MTPRPPALDEIQAMSASSERRSRRKDTDLVTAEASSGPYEAQKVGNQAPGFGGSH